MISRLADGDEDLNSNFDDTDDIAATSCDFEDGNMCGWFESSSSSSHWSIAGFPAPPPGPDSDHSHDNTTHDLTTTKNEVSSSGNFITTLIFNCFYLTHRIRIIVRN